jgi:hypothetical protein
LHLKSCLVSPRVESDRAAKCRRRQHAVLPSPAYQTLHHVDRTRLEFEEQNAARGVRASSGRNRIRPVPREKVRPRCRRPACRSASRLGFQGDQQVTKSISLNSPILIAFISGRIVPYPPPRRPSLHR